MGRGQAGMTGLLKSGFGLRRHSGLPAAGRRRPESTPTGMQGVRRAQPSRGRAAPACSRQVGNRPPRKRGPGCWADCGSWSCGGYLVWSFPPGGNGLNKPLDSSFRWNDDGRIPACACLQQAGRNDGAGGSPFPPGGCGRPWARSRAAARRGWGSVWVWPLARHGRAGPACLLRQVAGGWAG